MTADTRQGNGGRGGDDWLGAGDLDWGEAPPGARPRSGGSAPGDPLWPDHGPAGHPDEATIRRRRAIGLIVLVAAVGFVILVAVLAFGGGSNDNPVTVPTTTALTPPPPPPPPAATKPTTTPQTPTTGTLTLAQGQTLKTGDSGQQVTALQQSLKTLGYDVAVDGSFGAGTAAAVGEFQRDHDLADDGVVGPATVTAINNALASGSGTGGTTGTTSTTGTAGTSGTGTSAGGTAGA